MACLSSSRRYSQPLALLINTMLIALQKVCLITSYKSFKVLKFAKNLKPKLTVCPFGNKIAAEHNAEHAFYFNADPIKLQIDCCCFRDCHWGVAWAVAQPVLRQVHGQ